MCFKIHSFPEFIKLKSVWIDPKNKKYGKTTICTCGANFDKDRWCIETKKDLYLIMTIHLQCGMASTIDMLDHSSDYYFETRIFKIDQLNKEKSMMENPLDFEMRYKTKEEAVQGHKDTIDKLELIILNPEKYPMGILPRFIHLMEIKQDIMKKSGSK